MPNSLRNLMTDKKKKMLHVFFGNDRRKRFFSNISSMKPVLPGRICSTFSLIGENGKLLILFFKGNAYASAFTR